MIKLTLNNVQLVIDDTTQVTVEETSPLFVIDAIPVPYTLPFKIPLCPVNDLALRFLKNIDIKEQAGIDNSCSLYLHGRVIKGLLIVSDVAEYYEVAVIPNRNAFNPDKNLKDYDWGADLNVGNTGTNGDWMSDDGNAKVGTGYPVVKYNYPMIRNEVLDPAQKYINFYETDVTNAFPSSWDPFRKAILFSPQIYLLHIIDEVFKQSGLQNIGDWLSISDIKALVVYNNYVYANNIAFLNPNIANHIPDVKTSEMLNALRKYFNIGILFDFDKGTARFERAVDVLDTKRVHDYTRCTSDLYAALSGMNKTSYEFANSKDDDDEASVKIVETLDFNTHIEIATTASLPGGGDANTYLVLDENFFYRYDYGLSSWEIVGYNYIGFKSEANPLNKLDIAIGAPICERHNSDVPTVSTRTWNTPVVNQKYGNSKFTFRIYFYRGVVLCDGTDFPRFTYGTITNLGVRTGAADIGDMCLHWNRENGIYETQWKRWIDFLSQTKQYNFTGKLNASQINTFSFFDKIRVKNREFLCGRKRTTYNAYNILDTEMELYRI